MNAIALVHSHAAPSALIERDVILEALAIVAGVAPKKHTIPILNNVLIEKTLDVERCVTVRATDLDMQIEVNVRANVSEDFATTVPAHLLRDIVRRIPDADRHRLALEMLPAAAEMRQAMDAEGEPMFDDDGRPVMEEARRNSFVSDRLRVRLGRASFDLASAPAEDFPALAPFAEEPHAFKVAGSALWNAVDSVIAGMSTEETRYYLNGAYLHVLDPETLALTATDGHRLFRQEIRGVQGLQPSMPGVIIPRAAVNLLHTLLRGKGCPLEVEAFFDETKFAANWGAVAFITKTIDGTYPDYARVIPSGNDKIAVVSAPKLLKAIGALTALSGVRGRAVKCNFEANRLVLAVSNPEYGSGSIDVDCVYDDEPIEIGFNAGYLVDVVSRAAPDKTEVTVKMADMNTPALITGSISGWSGVLMPMRV